MKETERDVISLTKAVGIILVVLAHAMPTDSIVFCAIYTFHMPLFFIMSGYCFKEKYLSDAKQFVIRKLKGIYVPFISFSLPFLALHNAFCVLNIYNPLDLYGWKRFLWDTTRIVTRMSHNEQLLCTFWFLKELFWGSLIFYSMLRVWKGKVLPTTISLLVVAELFCLTHLRIPYFGVRFVSVLAAFFISVGHWWKQSGWKLNKWWMWLIGIALMVGNMLLSYSASMLNLIPETLPVYVLPAIVGTMMVFELCRIIQPYLKGGIKNFCLFTGNHSLFIMALHFLAFKVVLYGFIKVYDLPVERLYDFPVMYDYANTWGILLCTFSGILFPLCFAWLWQRGKQLLIKNGSKV